MYPHEQGRPSFSAAGQSRGSTLTGGIPSLGLCASQNLIIKTGDERGVPHSTSVPDGSESFLTAVTEIPFCGSTSGAASMHSGTSFSLR
jgi:hypothetical protein